MQANHNVRRSSGARRTLRCKLFTLFTIEISSGIHAKFSPQVCRICNATGQDCHADPETLPGEGILNADFVFYVSALQTERCHKGLTVAYAAHCQQEAAMDRPIAGHANLCPYSISTKPQELQTLLSTVKHEILHALGFSVSLYAFFRDDNGEPRTPRKPDTGKPYLNEK